MEFIYYKIKNTFIIKIYDQFEYEFENFTENINKFIREIYLICFEDEVERKFKLVNVKSEYECKIVKLNEEFLNLNIKEMNLDIDIKIANLIGKIVNVKREYYQIHSIDADSESEYDKYQKLRNIVNNI